MDFDQNYLERELRNVRHNRKSIFSLATWCVESRDYTNEIISSWANAMKESLLKHRLLLFYVANEILKESKKKNCMDLIVKWKAPLQKAMMLLKNIEIRYEVARTLDYWQHCGIYNKTFISSLKEQLTADDAPMDQISTADIAEDYQCAPLIKSIQECMKLSEFTKKAAANMPTRVYDSSIVAGLEVKEQAQEMDRKIETELACIQEFQENLAKEIESRKALIENNRAAMSLNLKQLKEVKIVQQAFLVYEKRVQAVGKALEAFEGISDNEPTPVSPDTRKLSMFKSNDNHSDDQQPLVDLGNSLDGTLNSHCNTPTQNAVKPLQQWQPESPFYGDNNFAAHNSSWSLVPPPPPPPQPPLLPIDYFDSQVATSSSSAVSNIQNFIRPMYYVKAADSQSLDGPRTERNTSSEKHSMLDISSEPSSPPDALKALWNSIEPGFQTEFSEKIIVNEIAKYDEKFDGKKPVEVAENPEFKTATTYGDGFIPKQGCDGFIPKQDADGDFAVKQKVDFLLSERLFESVSSDSNHFRSPNYEDNIASRQNHDNFGSMNDDKSFWSIPNSGNFTQKENHGNFGSNYDGKDFSPLPSNTFLENYGNFYPDSDGKSFGAMPNSGDFTQKDNYGIFGSNSDGKSFDSMPNSCEFTQKDNYGIFGSYSDGKPFGAILSSDNLALKENHVNVGSIEPLPVAPVPKENHGNFGSNYVGKDFYPLPSNTYLENYGNFDPNSDGKSFGAMPNSGEFTQKDNYGIFGSNSDGKSFGSMPNSGDFTQKDNYGIFGSNSDGKPFGAMLSSDNLALKENHVNVGSIEPLPVAPVPYDPNYIHSQNHNAGVLSDSSMRDGDTSGFMHHDDNFETYRNNSNFEQNAASIHFPGNLSFQSGHQNLSFPPGRGYLTFPPRFSFFPTSSQRGVRMGYYGGPTRFRSFRHPYYRGRGRRSYRRGRWI